MPTYEEFMAAAKELLKRYANLKKLSAEGLPDQKKNEYMIELEAIAKTLKTEHINFIKESIEKNTIKLENLETEIDEIFEETKFNHEKQKIIEKIKQFKEKKRYIDATDFLSYHNYLKELTKT